MPRISKLATLILAANTVHVALAQTATPPVPHHKPAVAQPTPAVAHTTAPSPVSQAFNNLQTVLEGPGAVPLLGYIASDFKAEPEHCSLQLTTQPQDTKQSSASYTLHISLRQASEILLAPKSYATGTVTTPYYEVTLFLYDPFRITGEWTQFGPDGKPTGAAKPYSNFRFTFAILAQADAIRLQSAWQRALTICQQSAPASAASVAAIATTAQQSVDFINTQLATQGKFHFVLHRSGDRQGDVDYVIATQTFTSIGNCITDFEMRQDPDTNGSTIRTPLEEVDPRTIVVEEDGLHLHNVLMKQEPNPLNIAFVADPPIFLISNKAFYGYFTDRTTAERVAKALIHAVAVCGGGQDQPF